MSFEDEQILAEQLDLAELRLERALEVLRAVYLELDAGSAESEFIETLMEDLEEEL